ncbi:DUF3048 domain-containing protein [bacterium]|nr:MAG: DUF3048 domain-containing protein [bacterium]
MSPSTSPPPVEPTSPLAVSRRRARHRGRIGHRGWIAAGAAFALLFTGTGAYLAYTNTLPTTVTTNFKNGQKDLPIHGPLLFTFSRPVALPVLEAALSITPATDGTLTAVSGQTQYSWSPTKPLAELTTYRVDLKAMVDVGHHRVKAAEWTFSTNIVPRLTSVSVNGGPPLADGSEIDPGSTLTLTFNDAMEPVTIRVTVDNQQAELTWAAGDRSATLSLAGMPSGPLVVQMGPGGRDQTRHLVTGTFTLKTGLYYHDREPTTPLKYPALIQIPNDEFAWDQNGLQAADVVFEYLAEGGITRLTAIFENAPDLIGPMRSSRFISLKIARHYKGLLFQSGESQATRARAQADPVPQFFDTVGYQFRTSARYAPDNLMIKGPAVNGAEQNYFSGLPAYTLPKARPVLSGGAPAATINVDEHYSVYRYDPLTGTYQKSELSHPYADASLRQPLRIEMLIVLHTQEQLLDVGDGHGAHIHDFNLDTGGRVEIDYKGMRYAGSWSSIDSHGPLTFTLAGGQPVSLPPGLVWIDVTG